ncbi:hypothetical protein FRC11_001036, partial [Ceratobasidium sp. 423]
MSSKNFSSASTSRSELNDVIEHWRQLVYRVSSHCMASSIASVESHTTQAPGTNLPKPSQPNKRGHVVSSSSETPGTGKKRRKSRSKKRKKKSKSVDSSSDSEATATTTHGKARPHSQDTDESDSNGDRVNKKVDRIVSAMEKRQQNDPEKELAACIDRIKTSKSDAYQTFHLPRLKKALPG